MQRQSRQAQTIRRNASVPTPAPLLPIHSPAGRPHTTATCCSRPPKRRRRTLTPRLMLHLPALANDVCSGGIASPFPTQRQRRGAPITGCGGRITAAAAAARCPAFLLPFPRGPNHNQKQRSSLCSTLFNLCLLNQQPRHAGETNRLVLPPCVLG